MYSQPLIAALGGHCFNCDTEYSLVIHHVDGNRSNNYLSNLEVLCRTCHIETHKNKPKIVHVEIPKRIIRTNLLYEINNRFGHGLDLMTNYDVGFNAEDIVQLIEDIGIEVILRRQEYIEKEETQ